jgi:hypothetical protein
VLGFNYDSAAKGIGNSRQNQQGGVRLQRNMGLFLSTKVVRLILSVSVSIWMAGGCLFGCSNSVMAHEADSSANVVEAGESCHAMPSHDCCAAKKPKKQSQNQVVTTSKQLSEVQFFGPTPRGMMNDCPLVVNATAATSKTITHVPDPGRVSVAVLPRFEKQTAQPDNIHVVEFLPNRGPTHLRCCVFLI